MDRGLPHAGGARRGLGGPAIDLGRAQSPCSYLSAGSQVLSRTMRKAFTLIEVVVSLGILAVILSFAGVIFRVSVDSQRLAMANAEIMQKLRVITEQLDTDFRGLCEDGEILAFWRAAHVPNFIGSNPNHPSAFVRYDTIMFFAAGDWYTYRATPVIRGNMARICYSLANVPGADPLDPNRPMAQKPSKRMLARTQHILTSPSGPVDPNDPLGMRGFSDSQWQAWNSTQEYDAISLQGWLRIPNDIKADIISVIGDIEVNVGVTSTRYKTAGGIMLNLDQPANSLHALICEGVGQFKVQGWSDVQQRWIPEVNPNGDLDLVDDSDFVLDGVNLHARNIP
ncbi:MAG: type II secretion system protein, partial [Planctomycetaceae bacterium]